MKEEMRSPPAECVSMATDDAAVLNSDPANQEAEPLFAHARLSGWR